jgi:hypothetical protein
MENDNWLTDLMHDMFATLLAEITLLWIEVDERRTSGIRLALLIRCSSTEAWSQRSWQM